MILLISLHVSCSPSADKGVKRALGCCPDWSRLAADDQDARRKVLQYLRQVSTNDVATIRRGVEEYLRQRGTSGFEASIFLLNRFIFNVPQFGPSEASEITPWHSPAPDGRPDLLWPFSVGNRGELELTGIFSGYTGEEYRPLEEFDGFLRQYGLRPHPGVQARGTQAGGKK
jgi:hypothetical protein